MHLHGYYYWGWFVVRYIFTQRMLKVIYDVHVQPKFTKNCELYKSQAERQILHNLLFHILDAFQITYHNYILKLT